MKISRNDPCPCGSGRKYKQCCLAQQVANTSQIELVARRVRREVDDTAGRLIRFSNEAYGPTFVDEAWHAFMLWDEDEALFDIDSIHARLFAVWLQHGWSPDPEDTEVADASVHGVVPTQLFLDRKGRHLSPTVHQYLQSCLQRSMSFYEIEHVDPVQMLRLRDLLTDERHDVFHPVASPGLGVHAILFAQLATADGVTLIEAIGPIAFSPGDKVQILELRQRLSGATPQADDAMSIALRREVRDLEVRDLYLQLVEPDLYQSPSVMTTTDGEEIEFHALVYEIESAHTAFDALKHLNPLPGGPDSPQIGVRRDADGVVQSAHIDWVRMNADASMESGTLLGTLDIDGTRLSAETNSRERANQLKTIIDRALGAQATFRADRIQTVEQAMDEADKSPPQEIWSVDDPAMLPVLEAYLRDHYTKWVTMPLPALGGRTPRDVVKTPIGREQVEALLRDFEQRQPDLPADTQKAIFDEVRQQLGLPM